MTINGLLAGDQVMILGGLRMILEDQPDVDVVGEATDGAETVELARRLRPDVCLVGIRMPHFDGIEVTRALAGPGVDEPLRVVIVATFDLDEYVYGVLQADAVGFVLNLLMEAVRAGRAGGVLVSPSITLLLPRRIAPAKQPGAVKPARRLSGREAEVVRAMARGCANQEIAGQLFISVSTVKSHLATV